MASYHPLLSKMLRDITGLEENAKQALSIAKSLRQDMIKLQIQLRNKEQA